MNSLVSTLDTVHIKDIRPGLKNFSITFIVLEVGQPVPLKENREVRTLKVADSTACINLSLWDEPGAAMSPGDIIRLSKAYAGICRNALTLYSGKNGDIHKIGSEPGSGMLLNVNSNLNHGSANNIGSFQNRTSVGLSASQNATDRKNTSRYSGDRERQPPVSGTKHQGKSGPRGGSRGGQRNIIHNEKR